MGYRYVNCARRFGPATSRVTDYPDARFAQVVRHLVVYSAHFDVLFIDEFAAWRRALAKRLWRFVHDRRVVRSVRSLEL